MLPTEVTLPVKFAFVVTVEALPVNAPTNVVDVTDVKPANVVDVPPNVVDVEPIVIVLFEPNKEPSICAEPDTKFGIVILAEPSKEVPLIVLAVANVVAVDALPVNDPVNPVEVTDTNPANDVCVEPNEIPVVPIVNILPLIDAPFTCIEPEIIPEGIDEILAYVI